ncbi:hypothetical protein AX17_001845 [Amanita inopinata Kibby_2008]|nr:hypothetical protein AX17_001845 [Amanita inopinata Kibby_2008]
MLSQNKLTAETHNWSPLKSPNATILAFLSTPKGPASIREFLLNLFGGNGHSAELEEDMNARTKQVKIRWSQRMLELDGPGLSAQRTRLFSSAIALHHTAVSQARDVKRTWVVNQRTNLMPFPGYKCQQFALFSNVIPTAMRLTAFFASAALAVVPALSSTVTVAYDTTYDMSGRSLATVACSDGPNGLITRGHTTFGSLPSFPHIGAAHAVKGWNSPACGTCWQLTYTNAQGKTKTIHVLAIDVARAGFNIALSAMNELTGGHAVALGRVNAHSKQVHASACGL